VANSEATWSALKVHNLNISDVLLTIDGLEGNVVIVVRRGLLHLLAALSVLDDRKCLHNE